MELSIFLGVCWDYKDWVEVDKKEGMSRRKRLELNKMGKIRIKIEIA